MPGFIKALAFMAFTLATGVCLAPSAYADAPYCREFTKEVLIGGQVQQSYGTACMQPDGSWQVVDTNGALSPQTVIIHDRQVVSRPVLVERQPSFYFSLNTDNYGYRSHRNHFFRHHKGPGAYHHWKHHKRVLHPHGRHHHR